MRHNLTINLTLRKRNNNLEKTQNPELFPGGLRFEFEPERQTPKTSSSADKRAHIPESHKAWQTKNSSQRAQRRRLPGSGPRALEDPTYCDRGSSAHLQASCGGGGGRGGGQASNLTTSRLIPIQSEVRIGHQEDQVTESCNFQLHPLISGKREAAD